jgi:hypothetical protein
MFMPRFSYEGVTSINTSSPGLYRNGEMAENRLGLFGNVGHTQPPTKDCGRGYLPGQEKLSLPGKKSSNINKILHDAADDHKP